MEDGKEIPSSPNKTTAQRLIISATVIHDDPSLPSPIFLLPIQLPAIASLPTYQPSATVEMTSRVHFAGLTHLGASYDGTKPSSPRNSTISLEDEYSSADGRRGR